MTDSVKDLVEQLTIQSLVLDECQVSRGDAEDEAPGKVEQKIEVEFSQQDLFVFAIRTSFRFTNPDNVLVARIDASFVAAYDYSGDSEPSEQEIEKYAHGPLLLTAVPFIREFLASMTNRLALPPFYLPLFAHRGAVLRARAQSGS